MRFENCDIFDVAGALYFWLQHNWDGQNDAKYEAFCQLTNPCSSGGLGFFRGHSEQSRMEEMEQYIYDQLTEATWREAFRRII